MGRRKNPYWPPLQWWLRDAEPNTPARHSTCRHREYLLTCAQFDSLLARSGGVCEICGSAEERNPGGKLHIDHVHELGIWAVRGLLCWRCNSSLGSPWDRPAFGSYAGNAFYMQLVLLAGGASLMPPEPEQMTVVRDYIDRPWRREAEGWWPHHPNLAATTGPLTWARLIYKFGPHNLSVSILPPGVPLANQQQRRPRLVKAVEGASE